MMRKKITSHQNIKTKLLQVSAFVIAMLIANLFFSNESFGQVSQIFSSPGTFINGFTVPSNVTSITVQVWGGGGGGGRAATNSNGKGGGGGGAYTSKTFTVNPGDQFTVVVGIGGSGGTSSADGVDGGQSSFGGVLIASGGSSGNNGTGTGSTAAQGGAGGSAGVTGTINSAGGNGGNGNTATNGTGGGGGASGNAAGTIVNGANGSSGGAGGDGPDGDGGNGGTQDNSGSNALTFGGGGGGRGDRGSTSGNGAPGKVIVTWCPTISASATKTDITCFTAGDGTITITGSGGASPYMFSIDNTTNYNATVIAGASYVPIDNNNGKFINLPVGTYKIRVKDANGCESKPVQ